METGTLALGVPVGAVVATHLGWRATFVGVSMLSFLALAVLGSARVSSLGWKAAGR